MTVPPRRAISTRVGSAMRPITRQSPPHPNLCAARRPDDVHLVHHRADQLDTAAPVRLRGSAAPPVAFVANGDGQLVIHHRRIDAERTTLASVRVRDALR